jgi:site-specific recombinase XerD
MHLTDYLEADDVRAMLDAAHRCSIRDYLLLRVLWESGMRISELLHVTPATIEPHNRVINVTKAKGGKQRRVHLNEETIAMVCDYVATHHIPSDLPVFAIGARQVENVVKRYGRLIDRDIHPHTFRHSFAIHCVRQGWDIRRLQQVLGHSSMATTAIYLQFRDADIRELYDRTRF